MSLELQATQLVVYVERWIAEARGGSRAALERLLESCLPYLLAVAKRELCTALRSRLDPVDVVQDTVLKALQNFLQFRGENEAEFLAWLRQILRNNLANERREHLESARRSVQREVRLGEVVAVSPSAGFAREFGWSGGQMLTLERCEAVELALRRLPNRYRLVLHLHTQEGLTFAQVGERLHCSAEAARKLWKRAARKLARLLRDSRET